MNEAQMATKREQLWESKKGQFALLVLLLATVMLIAGLIEGEHYQFIVAADVGAYIGGNVGEYLSNRGGGYSHYTEQDGH